MISNDLISPAAAIDALLVRVATPDDRAEVAGVLTRAFAVDPVARNAYRDERSFHRHFPELVLAMSGPAFEAGTAFLVADGAGAAVWLAPGVEPDEAAIAAVLERTVEADRLPQIVALLEEMDRHHPKESHWYLPLIGVDPARQGNGLGSALLRHLTGRLDREGAVAYLESSNPANVPLYRRHGFETTGIIRVPGAPTLYPMVRLPR